MKKLLTIIFTLFLLPTNNLIGQNKENLMGIEIGKIAPEIELPTVNGDNFELSQLRGKVVLLSFGASWCAPCRKKSPELIELFKKYGNADFDDGEKGFDIVSVSLDRNKIAWKNSIEKDGTEGLVNVGDMNGWKCAAAITYHIKSIPSNVLLNGEGKIIAINLSPQDLNKKLKQMKKGGWPWF